jgi:hypothetical protein
MRRCDAGVTGLVHQNVQRPVGFDALDQAAKRFAVGEIRGVTPATDLFGNAVERGSVSRDERLLRAGQLATKTATAPSDKNPTVFDLLSGLKRRTTPSVADLHFSRRAGLLRTPKRSSP